MRVLPCVVPLVLRGQRQILGHRSADAREIRQILGQYAEQWGIPAVWMVATLNRLRPGGLHAESAFKPATDCFTLRLH